MNQTKKEKEKEIKMLDEDHAIWLSTRGWKKDKEPKHRKEKK